MFWLQCLAALVPCMGHDPRQCAQAILPSRHSLVMTCTDLMSAPPAAPAGSDPAKLPSAEGELFLHKGLIQPMLWSIKVAPTKVPQSQGHQAAGVSLQLLLPPQLLSGGITCTAQSVHIAAFHKLPRVRNTSFSTTSRISDLLLLKAKQKHCSEWWIFFSLDHSPQSIFTFHI